jgi:hypothetical protein
MKIQNGCTIIQHGNRASKYNEGSMVKMVKTKKERKEEEVVDAEWVEEDIVCSQLAM